MAKPKWLHPSALLKRECPTCGDVFIVTDLFPSQVYCDSVCGNDLKQCTRCADYKTLDSFSKDKNNRDGLQVWCKGCYSDWYHTNGRSRNGKKTGKRTCQWCNASTRNQLFCSRSCYGLWRQNESPGIRSDGYTREFNAEFREYIRIRDNYTCVLCGTEGGRNHTKSYEQGKAYLIVHHIDFNKSNTTYENCMLVCASCHAVIHHIRAVSPGEKTK